MQRALLLAVTMLCLMLPMQAAVDAVIGLETVVSGLSSPIYVTHAGDGSGRLFILEQSGRIRIFKSGQLLATPFLNLTGSIESGGEKGLLGLAFHPAFETNRRFFVNYTARISGTLRTFVVEYRASAANPDVAETTGTAVLDFVQPFDNHNGGMIEFGSDGYLYIATGDGGAGGDPNNNGQSKATLLGKILRIDVDSASPYTVPSDNPFVGEAGARSEIWAYGLRNPWRFSFDRLTGRLIAGDVGQNAIEEVDIIVRGGNYGWRIMEGTRCFNPPAGCNTAGLRLPIGEYAHTENGGSGSVTGGYVYRGPQATSLKGAYIFGDYVSSRIWVLEEGSNGVWTRTQVLRPAAVLISSFGEDEQGELYVVDHRGSVSRILFGAIQVFAQVADGGGYTTAITATNTTTSASTGTVRFFNRDGTPRSVTLTNGSSGTSIAIQVPAGGTRVFQTSGTAAQVTTGMALLETTPRLGASATFRLSSGGRLQTLAGVLDSGFATQATLPVNTAGLSNTGVAISNPGEAPVNVRLVLVNRDGVVQQTIDPPQLNPLPAKAQVALFVTEMGFANATGLADSSLRVLVQGAGQIGVVSLLLEDGLLTVVPVSN
ncbi:MAG: PQQ-dependent sugar dehydrogenase [Acidobacteriota bacterium]